MACFVPGETKLHLADGAYLVHEVKPRRGVCIAHAVRATGMQGCPRDARCRLPEGHRGWCKRSEPKTFVMADMTAAMLALGGRFDVFMDVVNEALAGSFEVDRIDWSA